jgi:hypothetical protein
MANRVAIGVALANAIVLAYGLFRPDSLSFSIPFLVAPSLAVLWSASPHGAPAERKMALIVTWGVVLAAAAVVLINEL